MRHISIEEGLKVSCPTLRLGCLEAKVSVGASSKILLAGIQIQKTIRRIQTHTVLEASRKKPNIQSARTAYKALGKEPSRYRPSAEALLRRIAQGKGLYQINNVVDSINLMAIDTGFSIGGYDADRIEGEIQLGIGQPNEAYETIGRGALNIAHLPVLRDAKGAFGNPSSDSKRTCIQDSTQRVLLIYFDFGSNPILDTALQQNKKLLEQAASGQEINYWIST